MEKNHWSEADVCDKRITPAIVQAGWRVMEQVLREYTLRAGRVVVRGASAFRDKATVLRADYVLFHKPNLPLAVIEAKDGRRGVGAGMSQAMQYADLLQVSDLRIPAATNQACDAIVLIERSDENRDYVKLVFEKSYDEIRELSAGGAQPNLNVAKVKTTLISLSPLAEQSRIVTRVTALRRLYADLRQRFAERLSVQARLAEAVVETVSVSSELRS